jgi:Acyl-CoA carboxylase epsilon subunit
VTRPTTHHVVEADLVVLSGNPDADELAAVTAVLAGVLDELAAEQGKREQAVTSAWARSQKAVRTPLTPGPGAWRSFSG